MSQTFSKIVAGAVCLLGTTACFWDRPTYTEPTPLPSETHPTPPPTSSSRNAIEETGLAAGPLADRIGSFADAIAGRTAGGSAGSTAVFPLVSYDLVHDGPWVSALGEAVADQVTDRLREEATAGFVLGPNELEIRASDANVPRETLSTLLAVREQAPRLGIDVAVFGTVHRRDHVGRRNRHELTVELNAYDLQTDTMVAKDSFKLPSDRTENAGAWGMAVQEGTWLPLSDWPVPPPNLSFERELSTLCGMLARRVAQHLGAADVSGKVYIAPTDTSRFVSSVARLRAAQATFASELERRTAAAAARGEELDADAPLVLSGVEFGSLQVAEAYLNELREGLTGGRAMRFAENVSALMAEKLAPTLAAGGILVNDLGFTQWSDTQLVEGELALGGLARSQVARDALTAMGISHVVAPRIDALGQGFQLRVEILDLDRRALLGTTYVTIAPRYADELEAELDAPDLEPLPPVASEKASAGWDETYADAVQGVVYILDGARGTAGTGFLVSRSGLVMTNSHVVRGMSPRTVALWKDGVERRLELVADAPEFDLALLRLDSVPAGVHVFEFADDDDARVGLEVAVLGHPKETGGWVLSPGHLSSLDEQVVTQSGAVRESYMYTCPTRRGNSGSPVLLRDGRVIAVNSHGQLGDVFDATGAEVGARGSGRTAVSGELPGFSKGAPAWTAKALLSRVRN